MNVKPQKTAYELGDIIVEQAILLHGPWPVGMTLFIFEDAYGWSASISRPNSEADNFYRTCTLDLIAGLAIKYDLDVPRPSDDLSGFVFRHSTFGIRHSLFCIQSLPSPHWQSRFLLARMPNA